MSEAIVKAQERSQRAEITTQEDREKVDAFRNQVREEGNDEAYRELIKRDSAPHPDAKGYEDKH